MIYRQRMTHLGRLVQEDEMVAEDAMSAYKLSHPDNEFEFADPFRACRAGRPVMWVEVTSE